jgi:hypothetical protein
LDYLEKNIEVWIKDVGPDATSQDKSGLRLMRRPGPMN